MAEKPRVLIVDDDPCHLRIVKYTSDKTKWIHELKDFLDASEALEYLRTSGWRPHLIIIDLNMPRMNGFELLRELKNDPELAMIPVLVLTPSSSPKDIKQAYGLHANGFVTKPSDLAEYSEVWTSIESFWFKTACSPVE